MNLKKIAIVGGGLVGLGTARSLIKEFPEAQVTLFEKEATAGQHQSTHNSGVLHAGLYYAPGSLKARLAVEGLKRMTVFCQENNIAHEICGKIVVATEPEELPRLEQLLDRGTKNGLVGLKKLTSSEIKEREPHATGLAAVYVPQEGIVDYKAVVATLVKEIQAKGGRVLFNSRVTKMKKRGISWLIGTPQSEETFDYVINASGLYTDKVAKLSGVDPKLQIVPFRGEYYELKDSAKHLVKHLIYPVPDPQYPFLGVHFTRMIGGGVEAGPNAVLALGREGYRWGHIRPSELLESLSYRGFQKFAFKHFGMGLMEMRRSLSKTLYCKSLQRLIPEIKASDLAPGNAGVRAQAMDSNGALIQDFSIVKEDRAFHVLNAPSPAATSSLAIGHWIVSELKASL